MYIYKCTHTHTHTKTHTQKHDIWLGYFAAQQLALGYYQRHSLNHFTLITAFQIKGHKETHKGYVPTPGCVASGV